MAANVTVWLDEKDQLIHQRIEGDMSVEDFRRLDTLTAECVARLRKPDHVRILVDARAMGRATLKARREAMKSLRPNLKKMAFYGGGRFTKTLNLFYAVIAGSRIRTFEDEEEALAWLHD